MKPILLSLLLLIATVSNSQNLVPNPGFDINNSCPSQIGEVDKADGWSVWGGTPDYFHSCSNVISPGFGVPLNSRGFQAANSADAYMGLFTYSSLNANFREYVGRALSTALTIGQTYYVSFYINHADINVLSHSSNNIGIKFSTVQYTLGNPDTALNNAHVFLTTVVSDTANWIQVSGSFVADSAYTHFGIGNYFSDSATTVSVGTATANYAYYLIDDICVSPDQEQCNFPSGIINFNEETKIHLYPNPSNGTFNVQTSQTTEGVLEIYDVAGNKILEEKIHLQKDQRRKFEFENLAGGIYFVRIFNERIFLSEKLIVR